MNRNKNIFCAHISPFESADSPPEGGGGAPGRTPSFGKLTMDIYDGPLKIFLFHFGHRCNHAIALHLVLDENTIAVPFVCPLSPQCISLPIVVTHVLCCRETMRKSGFFNLNEPCRVGSVGSVSASRTVGREFASRPGHTKDHHKNCTNCLPA